MYLKEGQKLIVLTLDGLNYSLGSANSFFSKNFNPFFFNLLYNNRSLILERKKHVNPEHTFYCGRDILSSRMLIRDIFKKNQFINSELVKKISDNLWQSSGRLWLVSKNKKILDLVLWELNKSSIHKIGIIADFSMRFRNQHLKKDYKFINLSEFSLKQKHSISQDDIFLFLTDSQNINQFDTILSNRSLRFNKFFVLTDERNERFFDSVTSNHQKQDFRDLLKRNSVSFNENKIDNVTDWEHCTESEVNLFSINPEYFDYELPKKLLDKRLQKIENIIFNYLRDPLIKLIITAKFGQRYIFNPNSAEIVPFIIDEKSINKKKLRSPLESHLEYNCSTADVAPTILDILQIPKTNLITGHSMLPFLYPENHLGEYTDLGQRQPILSRRSLFE